MDKIRVLRVLEYRGPRDKVEDLTRQAVIYKPLPSGVVITGATIGAFGETLEFIDKQREADMDPLYVEKLDALAAIKEAIDTYKTGVNHYQDKGLAVTALIRTLEEILGNTLGDET